MQLKNTHGDSCSLDIWYQLAVVQLQLVPDTLRSVYAAVLEAGVSKAMGQNKLQQVADWDREPLQGPCLPHQEQLVLHEAVLFLPLAAVGPHH